MFVRVCMALVLLAAISTTSVAAFNNNGLLPTLTQAPILRAQNRSAVIQGAFIVQAQDTNSNAQIQAGLPALLAGLTASSIITSGALPFGVNVAGQIGFSYDSALIGFSLQLSVQATGGLPPSLTIDGVINIALAAIAQTTGVLQIEEDAVLWTQALENEETNLWHLDRVDQRGPSGDGKYYYNTTATNVHAYVIDTGIRKTHQEYEGRADWVFSAYDAKGATSVNAADGHGHGSHVAGTIGSKTFGLAKKVLLHAIKVLDDKGSGADSNVVAGLDWLTKNRVLPAVAVMSLGGGVSSSLDTAVKNTIKSGVSVVVAAGNSNADACNVSPAHVDVAITVAAMDSTDTRSSFSNYGTCTTLFAPGSQITSVSNADDTSSTVMSGTSMAAPHVAGVVALYLAQNPSATPAQVKSDIICFSTKDGISDPKEGSPNRLLFSFTNTGGPVSAGQKGTPIPSITAPAEDEPNGNNQNEQCTSASPCQGPFSATLTNTNKVLNFVYNTTAPGGFHRAWLTYNTGGGSIISPQIVQNSLYLMQWSDATQSWTTLASATDSNNQKNIMYQDTTTTPTGGSTFAWTVQAKGYTPSTIQLTFKLPSAAPYQNTTTTPGADICSGTTLYDPNPDDPNNVGQDPDGKGDDGSASSTQQPFALFMLLATAMAMLVKL